MSERVLISYRAGADPARLVDALAPLALSVALMPALPDTLLAHVEPAQLALFLGQARALAEVRNVEPDRMRSSLEPPAPRG